MKRMLPALAAPVLALSLLAPIPAHAAKVKQKDVPTLAQTTKVWSALKGGERHTEAVKKVAVAKTCKKTTNLKAASGLGAVYASGEAMAVPTATVVQFKSVKQAKRVIASNLKAIKCGKVTQDGATATYKKLATPKLGAQRVGAVVTVSGDGFKLVSEVMAFRSGSKVISASVVYLDGKRTTAKTKKFAKLAFKTGR
jgi:hypothetical protein